MKLGKLLAAGKSIMNGRADVSYRSSKQIYLPKFGSPKNPFKSEPPATTDACASASESATTHCDENTNRDGAHPVLRDKPTSSPISPPLLSASARLPRSGAEADKSASRPNSSADCSRPLAGGSPAPAGEGSRSPQRALRISGPAPQKQEKNWNKFNPLSILRAALPASKAGRSDNTAKGLKGTATQTELSLDSVKVVHNDLSDVDVEVVPIKSRSVVPDLPPAKKSWEFVGERLFGVEAT